MKKEKSQEHLPFSSSRSHRSEKHLRIVLEIHEAPQPSTHFPTALADSSTVSRSRKHDVGARTCVGRERRRMRMTGPYARIYVYACFDIDGLPVGALRSCLPYKH